MGTLYVRNLDERSHAILEKKAKEKKVSVSALVRSILQNYTVTADLESIDDKYRIYTDDMMNLYKLEVEEVRAQSQMILMQFMEKLQRDELLYEKIREYFEERNFD